jgi:transcriptional regulator with XRE-family HTH domain
MDTSFGHMLKVTRLALGYDQLEFAKELGISQSTYNRYEKGRTDPPLSLVIRLVKDYEFPAFLLFTDNLEKYISDIPIEYLAYLVYENNYTFNPQRPKTPRRKIEDIAKRLSEVISIVWFVRDYFNNLRNRHFYQMLESSGYDLERVKESMNSSIKVLNLDEDA